MVGARGGNRAPPDDVPGINHLILSPLFGECVFASVNFIIIEWIFIRIFISSKL